MVLLVISPVTLKHSYKYHIYLLTSKKLLCLIPLQWANFLSTVMKYKICREIKCISTLKQRKVTAAHLVIVVQTHLSLDVGNYRPCWKWLNYVGSQVIFSALVAWVTGDTQSKPIYRYDPSWGEDGGMTVVVGRLHSSSVINLTNGVNWSQHRLNLTAPSFEVCSDSYRGPASFLILTHLLCSSSVCNTNRAGDTRQGFTMSNPYVFSQA